MRKKKAYFIGIAGKAMSALANSFGEQGWEVLGSDHKGIYPPVSTYLQEKGLKYTEGYSEKNLPSEVDLVVVGRSPLMIDPQNPEYLKAKKQRFTVKSYPEVVREYLVKENSVVVAGTYGKTTITALLSYILEKAGLNPCFLIGGIPLNFENGVRITDSNFSVVEGDEPPALFKGDPSKFMFYKPKYLVLTATIYDHPEVFKTEKEYRQAFIDLVKLLPKDGLIVYNKENTSPRVLENFSGKKISYSFNDPSCDYFVSEVSFGQMTSFKIKGEVLKTCLLGKHNLENICAAFALASELGIKNEIIAEATAQFKGVKTRLEFLGTAGGRIFYWDFAQHPAKVKGTLEALRTHFPDKKIIGVYDPKTTGLKYKESLGWFKDSFKQADEVIVAKVGFIKDVPAEQRVSGKDLVEAISRSQRKCFYEPFSEKITEYLISNTKKGDIVVFMSSGGMDFTNFIKKTVKEINKE
jgi:UDP-N-acetylmuramate: L-alanyl-gamma-D-glutamyl-meso-diaminopimelate ligase